jgi:hypothetical protein
MRFLLRDLCEMKSESSSLGSSPKSSGFNSRSLQLDLNAVTKTSSSFSRLQFVLMRPEVGARSCFAFKRLGG